MPTPSSGAFNVAVARVRQIKRIANGLQTNLQALDKTAALPAGDPQLNDELTALAGLLTDCESRLEGVRVRSVEVVGGAIARLADAVTPGVSYTLTQRGNIETRST